MADGREREVFIWLILLWLKVEGRSECEYECLAAIMILKRA